MTAAPNQATERRDPAHRQALLAFATAAYEQRPLPKIDDWTPLLAAAAAHRLIPLAHHLLQQTEYEERIKQQVRGYALLMAMQSSIQEKEQSSVLKTLSAAGVDTIVLKGPALARTVYPVPTLRPSADLDVLVHQEDWVATHEALVNMGYVPQQPFAAPPPKVAKLKAYYHMQYDREASGLVHRVEVHYDLWWYGLRPALGAQYWQRAQPLRIGDAETKMVSPEDMLLHLCIHLHHHGYDRLVWFTDIALLLRTYGASLDWAYVMYAARKEGLGIFVYYSLRYLEQLLGIQAPPQVLAALQPRPLQAWLHDRLCPPHKVLAVDVTDRVMFDFHEVPEATELALNFVLTGRRLEKLAYLARLLVPSDEWLAYYYATNDPALLRRRRFTHAPAVLRKALMEIGGTLRHGVTRESLA